MKMSLKMLKQKRDHRAELTSNRQAIVEEGDRLTSLDTLSEKDETRLQDLAQQRTALDMQINMVDSQIEVLEGVAEELRALPAGDGTQREVMDPTGGFATAGEFFRAVYFAGSAGHGGVDERLGAIMAAAPSTYGNEGSGADGGYAVPPEFSAEIRALSLEEQAFLPMTDNTPLSGNSMAFPITEATPWGTIGARAFWRSEAAAATQSKPQLGLSEFRLEELTALVPMTNELLDDASALGTRINREASASIRWKTNDAIVNGSGAGMPLGFMNSGAVVSVAKETSQTADTVNATNVAKMWSRQLNPMGAAWMINPDVWPQLIVMTVGNQPIWTPPQTGMTGAPGGFLMGRPIIPTDTHQTVGDLGDISFSNLGAYATVTKRSGIQSDTSMHLWFDQNMTAFRFIFRVDGHPWLTAPVTPPNSALTRSPFVTLAARA